MSIFLVTVTIFRLLWLDLYMVPAHPNPSQGNLDLRSWEPISEHAISLDGEWEFFPNTFLIQDKVNLDMTNREKRFVQVPDNWKGSSHTTNAYGYGSYRLQIQVDPDKGKTYGLRILDISSASEVYVNGKLLAQSGKPADNKQIYTPLNSPYTTFFTLEDTNEIELVIQVANFDQPHKGGILQSPKFGLLQPFVKKANVATNIVIISCVVYIFHALYSFILFLFGNRDKRFLYFSLMVICIILGTLIGERLLYEWFPFNFEWRVKIKFLTMVAGGYFLLQCIKHLLPNFLRVNVLNPFLTVCRISILLILLLPVSYNLALTLFYTAMMLIPCLLAPIVMYRATAKINNDNIFLLLAVIASIYSLIWFIINEALKIEMISYPFDLMIASICFSTYWFKRYFQVLDESQALTIQLQKADKQKDEFLTTVAHEMRNPLHGILNISESIMEKEKTKLEESSTRDLELLNTIGRHMSTLLDVLLDLERLKENRLVIHHRSVSLHHITDAVIEMIRYMTDGKSIKLINRIPNNFPYVNADENRLIQILFNLLHNAVKYSHADEVSVHASSQGEWAKISVSDTGIGIDEKFLSKIFDRYEQATHDITSGFGLGLNICKQLVELHGGVLEVSTNRNEGTVFTFSLQLTETVNQRENITNTPGSTEYERIAATKVEVTDHSISSETINILAVDDDPVNLKILQSIFSEAPYKVFTATSGQKALSMLDKSHWDVIIADVMMPQMSGYELTRMIRNRFTAFDLPILLLTARGQPEDRVAGLLSGANDYVTKPIEGFELKARINTLANLKKSISERLRMEAALLQAQIQPHFLFNTINTIASLAELDQTRMTRLLVEFGNYLERSFSPENLQNLVPIEHELELLHSYLFIEKQRFGERLNIIWEVDKTIKLQIPPLSIQPLVENAIRHGVLKRKIGGTVHIRITNKGKRAEIAIIDDGVGMSEEKVNQILELENVKGVGIQNTNRRLKQMYGYGIEIKSKPDQGTMILFNIPIT